MQLEVPPYAALGAFSVNIWFKANNESGQKPQYIFSQASPEGVLASGAGPNQVSVAPLCFFSKVGVFEPEARRSTLRRHC